jgi:hypothetical protein
MQVNTTQVLLEIVTQNITNAYPSNPITPPSNPPPTSSPGGSGTIGSGGPGCPEIVLIY